MRRALLAAAALVATTFASALPAQAAGDCRISTPTKVAITAPYQEYKVSFSGECTWDAGYGSWDLIHPTQGIEGIFIYDSSMYEYGTTQYEGIYDWEPLGAYTVRGDGAWDSDYNSLYQNERTMTVKLGSTVSLSSSRSGSYVTLSARPRYYSPSYETYRPWAGATVRFYSKNSDGSWTWRRTVTSTSSGVATATISSSTTRVWKAVVADSSTKWGRTSSSVTR